MLCLEADITGLRGAEYNPRHIGPEERALLRESIDTIGMVKPLIARGDLLVAGHQRTNALRELGRTTAPLYALDRRTTVYDEIRFNQLHNGTDTDAGDENAHIDSGFDRIGFQVVDPRAVSGNFRGALAPIRGEICQMIQGFGPWGGCVATKSGKIIHAAQYALAASITKTPLTVAVIPDDLEAVAVGYLGRTYGSFSYGHLERKTYVQSLAQMFRLRDGESGNGMRSSLYENHVIPWLENQPQRPRLLDFGSGFGDYAASLRGRGHRVHDVELFRRKRGVNAIDKRAIGLMIDTLCRELREGPYDAIVLDSVLNSTDCLDAERHILTFCNAVLRDGGRFFFSGRPRERIDAVKSFTKFANMNRKRSLVDFLDKDGFTASYRNGAWFYQRYHGKAEIADLAGQHGFCVDRHVHGGTSWQVEATKVGADSPAPRSVDDAIHYEFDLPLGSSSRIGRAEDVLNAVAAMRGESSGQSRPE